MEKVFRDETYPRKPARSAALSMARGEAEEAQAVAGKAEEGQETDKA